MGIIVVALVLFVALIGWLIVSNLMEEKDSIITAHIRAIDNLEKVLADKAKKEQETKQWLVKVAESTKITEIRKQLLGYAQPKKPVDPKAKK